MHQRTNASCKKHHSALCTQTLSGVTVNKPRAPNAHGSVPVYAITVTPDFMVTESAPKPDHLCYKHEATQDARWSVDGFMPAHIYILLTGK